MKNQLTNQNKLENFESKMSTYDKKKIIGVDDMVLLSKLKEEDISNNLKMRLEKDAIYTVKFIHKKSILEMF
jgi:myosin heavy subunit